MQQAFLGHVGIDILISIKEVCAEVYLASADVKEGRHVTDDTGI